MSSYSHLFKKGFKGLERGRAWGIGMCVEDQTRKGGRVALSLTLARSGGGEPW